MIKRLRLKSNKKGMLLASQVLKMVIALISIIILIGLLMSLYFAKTNAQKIKEATILLKGDTEGSLNLALKGVREGTIPEKDFSVKQPKGWYLHSFTGTEVKPNQCTGLNCLCLCDDVVGLNVFNWASERKRQAKECDNDGVCLIIQDMVSFDTAKEFEEKVVATGDLITLKIKKQGELISITK